MKLAYLCLALALTATGCSTIKNLTTSKTNVAVSATMNDNEYYALAMDAMAKNRHQEAANALTNLITFYPNGVYAKQALLDLIYVQYLAKDFEAVTNRTAQFLSAYPNSPEAAYALYAQGVTHMQGSPKAGRLVRLDQSLRDTAYLRLAFADFSNLLARYPNSPYHADTAQRMTAIYNQFANHELQAAYWYVKRGAYVAAANRAKWVFQYYPQSSATPEALAILAYSNEQLGLGDVAADYKTLLKINYPNYLAPNGQVRLPKAQITPWQKTLSALSFGKLGRAMTIDPSGDGRYEGQTRTQVIESARQLRLPTPSQTSQMSSQLGTNTSQSVGLSLPTIAPTSPNSSQAVAIAATPDPVPAPAP